MNQNRYFKIFVGLVLIFLFSGCKTKQLSYTSSNTLINSEVSDISILRQQIISEAKSWLGTPYQYAGAEKGVGTDCSGMVMRIYLDQMGMKLPRNSARQAEFCLPLKAEEMRAGDLVFFATGKDIEVVSHVGIMLDDVNFIHASSTKGVVISQITTPYYIRTFKMFGRVPGV